MKQADEASPALMLPMLQCRDKVAEKGTNDKQANSNTYNTVLQKMKLNKVDRATEHIILDSAMKVIFSKEVISE